MEISWFQVALLGLFACLSSMPGLGGTSIGNYTLGRPLVGGLICGLILGDLKTGILCWYRYAVSLYRISYSWWNSICRRSCCQLHWYPTCNDCGSFLWFKSCFKRSTGSCYFIRFNGWYIRYSIILWNSDYQLSMAKILAGLQLKKVISRNYIQLTGYFLGSHISFVHSFQH